MSLIFLSKTSRVAYIRIDADMYKYRNCVCAQLHYGRIIRDMIKILLQITVLYFSGPHILMGKVLLDFFDQGTFIS